MNVINKCETTAVYSTLTATCRK